MKNWELVFNFEACICHKIAVLNWQERGVPAADKINNIYIIIMQRHSIYFACDHSTETSPFASPPLQNAPLTLA